MANKVLTITNENFEKEVLKADKPVIVDFWAEWCGPCRMVGPVMEQLAEQYEGKVKISKVNVDEESALAQNFRIMSIPTIMIFKDGRVVEKTMGARPKQEFEKLVNSIL